MTKEPWNKDKSAGQKTAFTPRQVEMIREFLTNQKKVMELALFNLGIDSMLRYCDVSKLKVEDVLDNKGRVKDRINIKQKKTEQSHVICLYDNSKESIKKWIKQSKKWEEDYLFTGKTKGGGNRKEKLSRTTYAKYVKEWAEYLHLDPRDYSTHSLRRTRAKLIYKETLNLEVVMRRLGQKSIESTRAYLGIDDEEAFEIDKKWVI